MAEKFENYQDCERYLLEQKSKVNNNLEDESMQALVETLKKILLGIEDIINCMEYKANEYIITDSSSEYREKISEYFGDEPVIEKDHVAMTVAYRTLDDCEANRRDIIIMVEDI